MPDEVPPPFDLYGLAEKLLGLAVAGMADRGVRDLPRRRYIAAGSQVAYDDEQVTVTPGVVTPGIPARPEPLQEHWSPAQSGRFIVCIVRNAPTGSDDGTPPSPTELSASAKQTARDVGALYETLLGIRSEGTLVDTATPYAILDVHQEGPLGGVVAVVGTIEIQLV